MPELQLDGKNIMFNGFGANQVRKLTLGQLERGDSRGAVDMKVEL